MDVVLHVNIIVNVGKMDIFEPIESKYVKTSFYERLYDNGEIG